MDVVVDPSSRALRGTDLVVSRLILGAMTFGGQVGEAEAERIVYRARERGVTMIDTADIYTGGRSEQIVGRIVAGFRDEVLIATKVGGYRSESERNVPRLDRASVLRGCDASLSRLGIDHIDLFYLHMPDARTPLAETLAACQDLVDAGKIAHVGISNHAAWQIVDAIRLAEASGWPRLAASQPMYNLLSRRLEEEYLDCTEQFGISNLVYNPLAGGLLTGKHQQDRPPAVGTRFAERAGYVDRYWNPAQFAAVSRLERIASDAGITLVALAMRWLLSRAAVDGVILGVSSLDHLEVDLDAAAGPTLDSATLTAVDAVWADLRGPAPAYNR